LKYLPVHVLVSSFSGRQAGRQEGRQSVAQEGGQRAGRIGEAWQECRRAGMQAGRNAGRQMDVQKDKCTNRHTCTYIQKYILCGLRLQFKTPIVKRSLSLVLFISTSNEHIF
jgi:hypothetical protein